MKIRDRQADARAQSPSAVREILKVAEQPDVLSFAGGLPAPELFPALALSEAYASVLRDNPGAALQYGITEGYSRCENGWPPGSARRASRRRRRA